MASHTDFSVLQNLRKKRAFMEPTGTAREEVYQYCDLVMKGGITSGVIYPSAVVKLASQYRFKKIGGTSAGAIAAAVAAAAEFGRRHNVKGAFDTLAALNGASSHPMNKAFSAACLTMKIFLSLSPRA